MEVRLGVEVRLGLISTIISSLIPPLQKFWCETAGIGNSLGVVDR